jgi:hypothetical protein
METVVRNAFKAHWATDLGGKREVGQKVQEKPLTPLGRFPNFSAQSLGQNDKRYCQPYWLFLLEAGVDGVLSLFLGDLGCGIG